MAPESPRREADFFGSLERRVLDVVWERGEASVRDVRASLGRTLAYTTVMTTLDRLHRKGVLLRRKERRAFIYSAAAPRETIEGSMLANLLRALLSSGEQLRRPLLSSLVEELSRRDLLVLEELELLVREKRRKIKRGD